MCMDTCPDEILLEKQSSQSPLNKARKIHDAGRSKGLGAMIRIITGR